MAYDWKKDWLNGRIAESHLAFIYQEMGMSVSSCDGKEYDLLLNNDIKIEVKYDILSQEYGNFFIEFWDDKPSGIESTHADIWVQYNGKCYFFIKVNILKDLIGNNYFDSSRNKSPETGRIVKGWKIPIPKFLEVSYKRIPLTKDWHV